MFRHHHRHQFTGNHELCSAFYTNNPLLYVSHYSEIIVAAGYEISQQHDVTAHSEAAAGSPWRSTSHVGPSSSAGWRPESLATRREAVELLSCDAPLLAYLVQNGAVSHLDAELIERETASSARQNIALLRCVDRAGRPGLSLLLNALRLTGQHQLANLLDYTPRIAPLSPGVEPTTCTPGFPSNARHRGQITIEIRVASVKLKSGGLCGSEWVSLSDIESHIDLLQQSTAQLRHRPRPSRMFKSPPTPTALSSRRRYRLQQVPDERRHSAAMFRFTAAATASTRAASTSTSDAELDIGNDRKYSGVLDCLAACLLGKKQHLRQQFVADNGNASSPVSKRSAPSQSPTSSISSMPVGGGSKEFQTGGVNCLLAGIELSGGFRMSLADGAVFRMSKDRHDVDIQMSPAPGARQPCRQSSTSMHHSTPASDDWQTTPRYQRHLAIARLRRSAELLRAKITQFCDVLSATGKCADDLTLRDRLVRYFERSCWLPVLDVVPVTETGERQAAVAVIVVCTTLDQLAALRQQYDIGLLRDDLQHHVMPSVDVVDGPAACHAAASPVPAAQRRRLLGDGDDAIVDAVVDVVIDHDELEAVKTELTQLF